MASAVLREREWPRRLHAVAERLLHLDDEDDEKILAGCETA
jgi:hypothetical protein